MVFCKLGIQFGDSGIHYSVVGDSVRDSVLGFRDSVKLWVFVSLGIQSGIQILSIEGFKEFKIHLFLNMKYHNKVRHGEL